ncbi:MAG: hypothetical protein HQM02_10575, partial [Magnetococcales bacterium]|nr:hypothetical protein [Magnetococcales bacterium]
KLDAQMRQRLDSDKFNTWSRGVANDNATPWSVNRRQIDAYLDLHIADSSYSFPAHSDAIHYLGVNIGAENQKDFTAMTIGPYYRLSAGKKVSGKYVGIDDLITIVPFALGYQLGGDDKWWKMSVTIDMLRAWDAVRQNERE